MTLLLYDYYDLEERASRHLNVWKAWHLILYALAGIFGILNYVFLQNTMQLVDNNCVLYPRELAFRTIELSEVPINNSSINETVMANTRAESAVQHSAQNVSVQDNLATKDENKTTTKRDVTNSDKPTLNERDVSLNDTDISVFSANETQRIVLDVSRTLFGWDTECQYAEYMPIMSMIFAAAWATFFTMCPSGGSSKTGLQEPWRILTPALLFALVMVGLTGHSFTSTNRGLYAFCSAFYNITNATTCSSVGPYLERSWNATWSFGGRAAAARAACAGVWASWACAAALFLARCLAAPDFKVRRTGAYLKDTQQFPSRDFHAILSCAAGIQQFLTTCQLLGKITPYLKKKPRRQKQNNNSPTKRETASLRSEPTATTELVTISIEQGQDTAPTTPQLSPMKRFDREDIEMTTAPQRTQ